MNLAGREACMAVKNVYTWDKEIKQKDLQGKTAETTPDPKAQKLKDIGNKHIKFEQYDFAVKEYTRIIEMCPDVAVFYTNRALCYLRTARYEECIEDCEAAIALDNLAAKAYYWHMQANECLGNYLDALKDCTTGLTVEPKNIGMKKSMERINENLRKNLKSQNGPNFTPQSENLMEIHAIEKPLYKHSSQPMRRVEISDVIGPKETIPHLSISDEDIDILFNSYCGPFFEVKNENKDHSTDLAFGA